MTKKIALAVLWLIAGCLSSLANDSICEPQAILKGIAEQFARPDSGFQNISRMSAAYAGARAGRIGSDMSRLVLMSDSAGDERLMCAARMFAGVCFINDSLFGDALQYVSEASKFSHDASQRDYLDYLRAVCYMGTGRQDLAAPCLENILSYGVSGCRPLRSMLYCESLRLMSQFYDSLGNTRLAFKMIGNYCSISDTLRCSRLPSCFLIFPQNIHNKYFGQRTVIVAGGPSLARESGSGDSGGLPLALSIVSTLGLAGVSYRLYKKHHYASADGTAGHDSDSDCSVGFVPAALFLDSTANAVSVVESDGMLSWVNSGFEQMYGSTLSEFILAYGDNAFLTSKIEGRSLAFEKCMTVKKSQTMVSKVRTGFNTEIWVKSTITPIISNGEISRYVVEDVDVSTLKKEKEAVEMINSQLMASLRNASSIQGLLMPSREALSQDFSNFVIYSPKDFVSGDFYWFASIDGAWYIAVGDCTGHGPSASLLSVFSAKTLDEIAMSRKALAPKDMLCQMDDCVIKSLRQKGDIHCDGLDITICKVVRSGNGAKITVAGAQGYFIYHSAGDTSLLKGAKRSIGGFAGFQMSHSFEDRELELSKGDRFFLTSDGIIDQNNPQRRSLGVRRFCDIIHNSSEMPLSVQQAFIEERVAQWSEGQPQRDDICVVGVEI